MPITRWAKAIEDWPWHWHTLANMVAYLDSLTQRAQIYDTVPPPDWMVWDKQEVERYFEDAKELQKRNRELEK